MRPGPTIKLSTSTKGGTYLAVIPAHCLYTVCHDNVPITLRLTDPLNGMYKYPAPAWTTIAYAKKRASELNLLFDTDAFTIAIVKPIVADTVQ